jgi:TatD DNase family protein
MPDVVLFDSHTHLESPRFASDREAVIGRARQAGVARMVTCGSDLATSRACLALAQAHAGVYAAVGIHPHEARSAAEGQEPTLREAAFAELAALAGHDRVVALGEMGLDYHYEFSPKPVQRTVLARQLALGASLGLPVILHNRESDDDFREIVDAAPTNLRGVLHCFLADRAMAEWALARGLYLGIGGPITFRNVTHLDEIVTRMPRERLLIETDCPYLAPHPKRGRRNEPAFVRHVAEHIAGLWGATVAEVGRQTTANANQLFGLEDHGR